jgi:hypothetical protein
MTSPAIAGQAQPVRITITEGAFGGFQVTYDNGGIETTTQAGTLDSALAKAAGENVPENYVLHAAAILRGILAKAKR